MIIPSSKILSSFYTEMGMSAMIRIPGYSTTGKVLLIGLGILFLFGSRDKEKKIENIVWSVPIPPDLLSRLRDFSPVAISKTSGIYLDDVFDILKGSRARTAPEIIEKLTNTIEILQKRDEELEKEAARIGFMIKGFDAIEQRELERHDQPKRLGGKVEK